jgi:hypothetical protein
LFLVLTYSQVTCYRFNFGYNVRTIKMVTLFPLITNEGVLLSFLVAAARNNNI